MIEMSRWIEALGVRIVTADLGALDGGYMRDHNAVVLHEGLGERRPEVLAHLLGHAFYGHRDTSRTAEKAASDWACWAMGSDS